MKEFKKSDLKSGQVVVTRNGNKYIVVGDLLIRNKGYNSISGGYKEDLTSLYYDGFDIMKVYERNWDRGLESIDDLRTATLVWKREEPVITSYSIHYTKLYDDGYLKLEAKVSSLEKVTLESNKITQRNNVLHETELKTKLDNPMLTQTARELIESILNEK